MKYVKNVMNVFALAFVFSTVSSRADIFSDAGKWAGEHKAELALAAGAAYGAKKAYDYKQAGGSLESFKGLAKDKAQYAMQKTKEGAENFGKRTGLLYEVESREPIPTQSATKVTDKSNTLADTSQQLQQNAADFQQGASSLKERMKEAANKPWYRFF